MVSVCRSGINVTDGVADGSVALGQRISLGSDNPQLYTFKMTLQGGDMRRCRLWLLRNAQHFTIGLKNHPRRRPYV